MSKPNRSRKHTIVIKMNDTEYEKLKEILNVTGLTKQDNFLKAAFNKPINNWENQALFKSLGQMNGELINQLRAVGNNINQMAIIANKEGHLPSQKQLEEIHKELIDFREEFEEIWQSIKSLIRKQQVTQQ